MRKQLTGLGPRIVYGAEIAVEKYAPVPVAFENSPFFGIFDRIVPQEIGYGHAQIPGQALRIAFVDLRGRNTATVSALSAIDGFLDSWAIALKRFSTKL